MGIWDNSRSEGGPALVSVEVTKASGVVVDVTGDVLHPSADVTVQMAGRQTELGDTAPGFMDLDLNNASGVYTPGSAAATTQLTLGMPVTMRETVGRKTFELFAGNLNQPEASFNNLSGVGDRVSVTAVDWIGQQQQGRTFVSNLAEYIRYNGASDGLIAYWPLADRAGSKQAEHVDGTQSALRVDRSPDTAVPAVPSFTTFGAQAGPRMDDGTYLQFNPAIVSSTVMVRDRYANRSLSGVSMSGQGAIAISLWYYPTNVGVTTWQTMVARDTAFTADLDFSYETGRWKAIVTTNTGTTTITGNVPVFETWQLLTVMLNIATGAISFWVDRVQFTGSIPGGSTSTLTSILVDAGSPGSAAAHLQVRLGTTAQITQSVHLAQYDHATNPLTGGLRWQRSDERLRTLARYAGLTDAQLDYDRGVAYMPKAGLAGSTWAAQSQLAVATEQGRLITSGNGNQRFHNRINARYNL